MEIGSGSSSSRGNGGDGVGDRVGDRVGDGGAEPELDRSGLVEAARDGVRVVVYAMFGAGKMDQAEAVLDVLEGDGEASIRCVARKRNISERLLRENIDRVRRRCEEVRARMEGEGDGSGGGGERGQP